MNSAIWIMCWACSATCWCRWMQTRSIVTSHRTTSRTVRAASPNASQRLLRAFVDGNHVIIHYHVKRDPEDRGFVVMDIFRLTDGMVVEHWDCVQDVPAHSPNPISMF